MRLWELKVQGRVPETCKWRPRNELGCPCLHTREGNGTPLQYSCLENPMDGGAWWAAVHGIAKSRTRLSDFTFTFHSRALEKEMATHSSVLAWRIPEAEAPGRLPSRGSHRVWHDWSNLAAAACLHTQEICIVSDCPLSSFLSSIYRQQSVSL